MVSNKNIVSLVLKNKNEFESLKEMPSLEHLFAIKLKIDSIPDFIFNLINLKTLSLETNKLTSIPDSIGNLINLEKLILSYNQLTSLPDSIGNLIKLETLELDKIRFMGYAFQVEMKYRAYKKGFKIMEVPIIFTDRVLGISKMSTKIFKEAFIGVIQMRFFK